MCVCVVCRAAALTSDGSRAERQSCSLSVSLLSVVFFTSDMVIKSGQDVLHEGCVWRYSTVLESDHSSWKPSSRSPFHVSTTKSETGDFSAFPFVNAEKPEQKAQTLLPFQKSTSKFVVSDLLWRETFYSTSLKSIHTCPPVCLHGKAEAG